MTEQKLTNGAALRAARPTDRPAVEALLGAADLPLDGLDDAWPHLLVADADQQVVGAAGMERYDDAGLLRSVVVAPERRGQRLGETLVRSVIAEGARAGIVDVWLLTFVPEWFERLGFARVERAAAPDALQASAEFAVACPDTAVAMRRAAWHGDALAQADPCRPLGGPVFGPLDDGERQALVASLDRAPDVLRAALRGLDEAQLETAYRPGGWTVRQVVHHLADAHMNGAVRLRMALTDPAYVVQLYDEQAWGNLPDTRTAPVTDSLALFAGLHRRIVAVLRSLEPVDFERRFRHPEMGEQTLDDWLRLYAWHGAHHTAQIQALRARRGW